MKLMSVYTHHTYNRNVIVRLCHSRRTFLRLLSLELTTMAQRRYIVNKRDARGILHSYETRESVSRYTFLAWRKLIAFNILFEKMPMKSESHFLKRTIPIFCHPQFKSYLYLHMSLIIILIIYIETTSLQSFFFKILRLGRERERETDVVSQLNNNSFLFFILK